MIEFLSLTLHGLAAAFLIYSFSYTSYVLARKLVVADSVGERYCAMYVCACWLLTVGFHVLIGAHQFNPTAAVVLAISGVLLTWRFGSSPNDVLHDVWTDFMRIRSVWVRERKTRLAFLLAPFALFALLVLARLLFLPLLAWDSLTYHGLKAALWVQQGAPITYDAPGGWEYYRYCFPGGEIFTAWAMLPFHSDLLAGLPDFVHWLCLGLITYSIAVELGTKPRGAILVTCFLLLIPSQCDVIGGGYVDVALNAQLLGSVLFLIKFLRTKSIGYFVLACAAMGLAIHIKPLALAWAGLLGAAFLTWFLLNRAWQWFHWRSSLCCIAVFLASFGPNWLDNALTCGYPLGSTPIAIGPLQLGFLSPSMQWMFEAVSEDIQPYHLAAELQALAEVFDGLTLSCVATCLLGAMGTVALMKRQPWPVILCCLGILATVINMYQPSFSVVRLYWASVSGRFFLPGVMLATVLGASFIAERRSYDRIYRLFLLVSGYYCLVVYLGSLFREAPLDELVLILIGSLVVLVALALAFLTLPRISHRYLWLAIAVAAASASLGLCFVQEGRDRLRITAYSHSTLFHNFPRHWVPALAELDREPAEKRIAVLVGPMPIAHRWFVYPFLGSRLENHVCYVSPTRDGKIVPHHPRYLEHAVWDYDAWLRRLKEQRLTHIVCLDALPQEPPPQELQWMEGHGNQFVRLVGDGRRWGLYQLENLAGK